VNFGKMFLKMIVRMLIGFSTLKYIPTDFLFLFPPPKKKKKIKKKKIKKKLKKKKNKKS